MVSAAKRSGAGNGLFDLPRFSSIPTKLIKEILMKEYEHAGMWELLPETPLLSCCHSKSPRRGLVTDINECYATMAAVLSTAYPAKALRAPEDDYKSESHL
jgi:hypothetical protein